MGSLLSSFFSLLSSLLSPLRSLSGRYGARKGWFPSGGFIAGPLAASGGLSALFSLLSSFCSLLSLLSSLLSRCHSFLRSYFAPAPCDLRIRPPTSPPTASTLCGSLPGPAECAKRLNNLITPTSTPCLFKYIEHAYTDKCSNATIIITSARCASPHLASSCRVLSCVVSSRLVLSRFVSHRLI